MDLEVKIKLVALGWNGKENVLEFFENNYNMTFLRLPQFMLVINYELLGKYETVSFSYETDDYHESDDYVIDTILRFFRTENGTIIGPNPGLLHLDPEDWT